MNIRAKWMVMLAGSILAGTYSNLAHATQSTLEARNDQPEAKTAGASVARDAEIIVTATKQAVDLKTIPASLSVLSGKQLEAVGANSFADYLALVPGVVFNDSVPGWSFATIRGVASTTQADQGQGTTGYYFDDIPLTDPTYSIGTPDVDAFDANNITVLRGPQASLFGAAALGGAINYKPNPPSLSAAEARFQGTISDTKNGAMSWSTRGMANLPIVNGVLAARGVFYHRTDGGFYDNLGTGKGNSNETRTDGGRLILLWQPADNARITYTFLYQRQVTDDVGYEEPVLQTPFAKTTPFPESFEAKTRVHALRVDVDTRAGTLTALGSYHTKSQHLVYDATPFFAGLAAGVPYYINTQIAESKGPTAELRLASPSGGIAIPGAGTIDYVIGAFYANNKDPVREPFTGPGVTSGVNQQWGPIFGNPTIGDTFAAGDLMALSKQTHRVDG